MTTRSSKFTVGQTVSFKRGKLPPKKAVIAETHILHVVRDENNTRHVLKEEELKADG